MQVGAIYDHGRLKFTQSLQLKRQYLRLIVEVPDTEIIEMPNEASNTPTAIFPNLSPEVIALAQTLRNRLDAVRHAPLPPDDELPEFTEKQLDRIRAFELREDR
uniref:Uncharacterized protein n=1 Tax=Candidatus Kentrum sp. SD TaxID=2126332 RepID=A0A451BQV8_9GAMM|nr:MAG: hypothetical protein BECKSD772D_GA0070982_11387 [Candidatus Kentron sp. SD]